MDFALFSLTIVQFTQLRLRFVTASVCGRRAGKVARRRRDGGNEGGAQRRRRAADGSPPLMRPTIAARDERAVLRSGTGVVERDKGRRAARGTQQTARWSRRADRFD